jgi:NAD(P)-dependent dehydrogenase (short-subunit alcohol dehydrogenase family)
MEMFNLSDKVVVITGAAGGIGRALVRGFYEARALVLPVVRQSGINWEEQIDQKNNFLRPLICDLSKQEAAKNLTDLALDVGGGRIDVLINNASICPPAPGNPYDEDLRNMVFATDFETPYRLCAIVGPIMGKQGGGSIINVTSMNAEKAWPGNPAYVTAKSALRLLTKAVARDFGHLGVRANNLCPGYIKTKMTSISQTDPILYEERRSHTMLGRWGEPEDLVGPALFLASDLSKYVTGIDLYVDGGWSAKGL